ncbi:MAG: nuclear transport factor 2 family protein, partial [Deltaproteobacteria bacterium]
IEYAGDGLWSYQEDVYNWERALEVLGEWSAARKSSK